MISGSNSNKGMSNGTLKNKNLFVTFSQIILEDISTPMNEDTLQISTAHNTSFVKIMIPSLQVYCTLSIFSKSSIFDTISVWTARGLRLGTVVVEFLLRKYRNYFHHYLLPFSAASQPEPITEHFN